MSALVGPCPVCRSVNVAGYESTAHIQSSTATTATVLLQAAVQVPHAICIVDLWRVIRLSVDRASLNLTASLSVDTKDRPLTGVGLRDDVADYE